MGPTALSRKIGKLSLITYDPESERGGEIRSPPALKCPTYDIPEQQDLMVVNRESRLLLESNVPRVPSGGPS